MMQLIKYPQRRDWQALLKRPSAAGDNLRDTVEAILNDVRDHGDKALRKYTLQFDGFDGALELPAEQWASATTISDELKRAIDTAIANITRFHETQCEPIRKVETMPGVVCWRQPVPVERAGLYIPGGSAPLFSTLLMLAIPARIAGCRELVLCTPGDKNGQINPAILYAAQQTGVQRIFRAGGAQAIAAMAYGTESIPAVAKIFGPGNQYVTCAKMLVQMEGVAIDMPAGPSEVAVLADETCIPAFVAADLLSQAEHGPDSQVILVCPCERVIQAVLQELEQQTATLPRKDISLAALANSKAILVSSMEEGMALLNDYAPEHLIIASDNYERLAEMVVNAGSVFLGHYSPESAGDYASGTNHTLPTNGFARAYSGVSVDSFVRKITYQQISREGLSRLGSTIVTMAQAEGLQAHANAVLIRS